MCSRSIYSKTSIKNPQKSNAANAIMVKGLDMAHCEECGREFQAYCAKCRERLRCIEAVNQPSDELVILMAYDPKTKLYRFGCNVKDCPCNLGNGWCSKSCIALDKKWLEMMLYKLHEYDGDNCIKQFCG